MADPLPVPAQLMAQLDKCKTVRSNEDYYKSRNKTAQEIKDSKSKLPDLPPVEKQSKLANGRAAGGSPPPPPPPPFFGGATGVPPTPLSSCSGIGSIEKGIRRQARE